jgi:hypothetical protein
MTWFSTMRAGGAAPESVVAALEPSFGGAKVLKVAGFKAPGDPLMFWRAAGETLGEHARLLEQSSGEIVDKAVIGGWMDVRYEPDKLDTYRHANVGQPLHSDGAYASIQQDIGLFYLERQASEGGESLFVDAEDIARRAAALHPTLHHELFSVPVRFGKGSAGRTLPILREVEGRLKINWNWFRVLPDQGEQIDGLREKFRLFLEGMEQASPAVAAFRLNAGEAVFFRDDEVLHGRRGYAAKASGDRLLWKTYFISPAAQARGIAPGVLGDAAAAAA